MKTETEAPVTEFVYHVAEGELTDRRTYECAAWYTNLASVAQTATIRHQPEERWRQGLYPHPYVATIEAVVTDDFFPSLFCGNLVGKPYDTKQNAGKPEKFTRRFTAFQLLADDRVEKTDAQYDALLAEAIAVTEKAEAWYWKSLVEDHAREGGPCRCIYSAKVFSETTHRLADLTFLQQEREYARKRNQPLPRKSLA